ncbi:MAG TPA: efflux RND transporter periplasmic adaptor subunit [Acidobacteriota bacterium]
MANQKSFIKKNKKVLIITGIVAVVGLIILLNLGSKSEASVKVTVEKVGRQDLTSIISASGEVKPKKNIEISAHVPGRIAKIGVKEGDLVKKGDFLLKLDSIQYEADADRNKAMISFYRTELERSTIKLNQDKAALERQKRLFDSQLISREQLEAAQVQQDISQAQHDSILHQIEQSQASLRSSMDSLSKTTFSAPIDGIITSLRVEEGEVAIIGTMNNPGTVLMTIADLSVMEVEVEVDETDVVNVRLGQKAEVHVDALPDQTIVGQVTEVGSSALQKLGTASSSTQESKDFKVVVTLDSPPSSLKPGLSASADIIAAKKTNVLAIPISALVLQEKKAEGKGRQEKSEEEGVFIVNKEGRASFKPVRKGITGDLNIEIASGLEEGQEVVVGPYNALRQLKEGTLIKRETPKAEIKP